MQVFYCIFFFVFLFTIRAGSPMITLQKNLSKLNISIKKCLLFLTYNSVGGNIDFLT